MASTSANIVLTVVLSTLIAGCYGGPEPLDPAGPVMMSNTMDDWGVCDLIVDDTYLFYIRNRRDVVQIEKVSGTKTILFSLLEGDLGPMSVATDGSFVYWTSYDRILRIPRGGGAIDTLAQEDLFRRLTLTGDRVYYTVFGSTNPLRWVPKSGGPSVEFPIEKSVANELVADSENVYFSLDWSVAKIPLDGGTPTDIANLPHNVIDTIIMDDSFVYYAEGSVDPPYPGTVRKMPKAGGETAILSTSTGTALPVNRMAVDSDYVYWTTNDTATDPPMVVRMAKEGGTPEVLHAFPSKVAPCGLAVDDQHIYWGMYYHNTGIYRMPKPK